MSYDVAALIADLQQSEGTGPMRDGRHLPYTDTVGKVTIGYGRNLTDRGISRAEAAALLASDLKDSERDCDSFIPWWRDLDPVRQRVMVELMFNMGWGGGVRGLSTFKNTLRAVREGRYTDAANGLRHSHWASQVKGRADRIARQMETGAP